MPQTPILGQIMPFAGTIVPRGWAQCAGQLLPISGYQALFSLLGTFYGGNGISTFGLPDLRGRAILGADTHNLYPPGMMSGEIAVLLSPSQIPIHSHGIQATSNNGAGRVDVSPTNNIFATNTLPNDAPKMIFVAAGTQETALAVNVNVMPEGSNQPHNNMQPYLPISYLIALEGIYPTRN
jgi:microcystin-dependent protein